MARISLKFVKAYVDRHGKARHYFRKPGCKTVTLPGLPGSDEFMAAYSTALTDTPRVEIAARQTRAGSIGAMIVGYLGSAAFHSLAMASQNEYRRILEGLRRDYGDLGIATLARKHVMRMLDAKAKHPAAARDFLRCLRLLVQYAIGIGVREDDPTAGVRVKMPKSDGYRTWSEEDIAAFEAAHPVGSKPRLALALLLNTALRCTDVVKVGRGHARNGTIHVTAQKTKTPLAIPITAELAQAINAAAPSSMWCFSLTSVGKRSLDEGSRSGSVGSVSRQVSRVYQPMGCGRRRAEGSPRPDVAPMRLPLSAATSASPRWHATRVELIRRSLRATPWPGPERQHRVSNPVAGSV